MEEELTKLKNDNVALQKKIAEDQREHERKIERILKQEREKFEASQREMKQTHKEAMAKMEKQLDDNKRNYELTDKREQRAHEQQMKQLNMQQENFTTMMTQMSENHKASLKALEDSKKKKWWQFWK